MSVLNPGILTLGKLPPSIPVLHANAGDEIYYWKIRDALVGIRFHGDMAVPTLSALDKRPGWQHDTFDTVTNPLVPGDTSAWHLALKGNPQVQQKVHDYIRAYVQAHPPDAQSALGAVDRCPCRHPSACRQTYSPTGWLTAASGSTTA